MLIILAACNRPILTSVSAETRIRAVRYVYPHRPIRICRDGQQSCRGTLGSCGGHGDGGVSYYKQKQQALPDWRVSLLLSYVCERAAVGALDSCLWSGRMWSAHHHLGTLDYVDARRHAYALGVTSLGTYAMHQTAVDTVDGHGLGLVGTDDNLAFAASDCLAAGGLNMPTGLPAT